MTRSLISIAFTLSCLTSVVLSQCIPQTDDYDQYSIQICPLAPAALTPPTLTTYTEAILSSVDDGVSQRITLPWTIMMYGTPFDYAFTSTNGAFQLGSTPFSSTTSRIPLSSSYTDAIPLIAAAMFDQYVTNGTSRIYWGVEGQSVGGRRFVMRYERMSFYSTRATDLSYDIIFSEATPSQFVINYYNYPVVSSSQSTTIGIQSNDVGTHWTLFNGISNAALISTTLHQKQLQFSYVGRNATGSCSGLGYNFESLRGQQLRLVVGTATYHYAPCGIVSNDVCQNDVTSHNSMICQVIGTAAVSLGSYSPNANWQFTPGSADGVQVIKSDGERCTTIGADRVTRINYICASTPVPLFQAALEIAPCVFQLDIATSLACGAGSRSNVVPTYVRSTLRTCVRAAGIRYNGILCPRDTSDLVPFNQTTPINLFTNPAFGAVSGRINIGFNFPFYGESYGSVIVSTYGALHFNAAYTSYFTTAPAFGTGVNTDYFPSIASFSAYLSADGYAGLIEPAVTYSSETINGQRAFVVRFSAMLYGNFRGVHDMSSSWDVILFENGNLEQRFYRVAPNPAVQVQIGVHGPETATYTSMMNYEYMTSALAWQLQGATLNYTYSGRTSADACQAFGVDFSSSITQDLVFQTVNGTYYINPCGTVTSTSLCQARSPASSICQVANGVGTSLTTFNPSSVVWSTSPSFIGLQSTVADGAYCAAVSGPRRLSIDWVCDRSSMQTRVVSVEETTPCIVRIVLHTRIACMTQAACTNLTDSSYAGSHCPFIEPQMALTNPTSILSLFTSNDDAAVRIALQFPGNAPFKMYGLEYRYVWIGTNGVLAFGISGVTGVPVDMPITLANLDKLPVIAAFWADFVLQASNLRTNVLYSRETINGEPVFVVRYVAMDYYLSSTPSTVTMDILMYAGSQGKIEIRYYDVQMPSQLTSRVNVGILSDDSISGMYLYNNENITPSIAASISNSTLLLTYHGPDAATALCGGLGYNLSSLAGYELQYEDTTAMARYAFKMCGVVSQCGGTDGDISMMCQQVWTATTTTNRSLSIWNPSSAYWVFPTTASGVTLFQADGTYCATISKGRTTITNFVCSASATAPVLVSVSETSPCVFQSIIQTNTVCGRGDRDVPVPPIPTASTLTSCQSFSGRGYDATLCPRGSTDLWFTPEPMTNPTAILSSSAGATLLMNMPFPFFFYETRITSFYVASSGLIEFGTSNIASTNAPFPSMGFTTSDYWPMIVAFWTQLSNFDNGDGITPYTGSITWSFENVPGNRHLIFRYKDVNYYTTREDFRPRRVSFDIVLTEGEPGGIEVRYYRVDEQAITTTVIGLRGLGDDMTIVQNEEILTPALAGKLRGTTLRYRFTSAGTDDFCKGVLGYYNFSSLSAYELNWNSSTYAYYYRPCEIVTAAKCRAQYGTARSTLCRAFIATTVTTLNMAADAPTSTTWEVLSTGQVRATYASGSYCSTTSSPRVAVVDYMCNSAATTPFISYLNENTTCTAYVVVQTSLACRTSDDCTEITGNQYNALRCQSQFSMRDPPPMTSPLPVPVSGVDDGTAMLNIPWDHAVYAGTSNNVWVCVNGWIGFGQTTSSLLSGTMPLGISYTDTMPIVAVFLTDLHMSNRAGDASIIYSIEGTQPNRCMVIRWNKVNYYSTKPASGDSDKLLTFEVRLYEGSLGRIQTIYYGITPHTSTVTMGIQSNDGSTFTSWNNARSVATVPINSTYAEYVYTGSDRSPDATCGGLGYVFNALKGADLSLNMDGTTVYYNPCGVVVNNACASRTATERSMACAVVGTTTFANLAIYVPTAAVYTYLTNGVQQYMRTGAYCSGTSLPSTTYTDFLCNSQATTPRFVNFTLTENRCLNRIVIETTLACGGGNRINDGWNTTKIIPSTLTNCITTTGSNYNSQLCPRNSSSAGYIPVTMTSPVPILARMNDAVQDVPIGFPFMFYGQVFTHVNVSSNGLLQFGEGSTETGASVALSSTSAIYNNWPVISPLWTDLFNTQSDADVEFQGYIQYSHEGTPGNRKFILRFNLIDYWNYRYYPASTGVSFDVVLSEASENSGIEVRYYRVDANPTIYAVVGVRADSPASTAYTAYMNRALLLATTTNQLQGATMTYQWTGQSISQSCGYQGYSLRQAAGYDMQWTNSTTGRTYYHRPCGTVVDQVCSNSPVTSQSSLCEAINGLGTFSATSFNPSAATWSRITTGATGLRLQQQTGTYCPTPLAAPRIATIEYMCDRAAVVPVLLTVVTPNACTYNAVVNTASVCDLYVPSSSSAAPAVSSSAAASSTASPSSSASQGVSSSTASPSSSAAHSSSSIAPSSSAAHSSSSIAPSSSAAQSSSSTAQGVSSSIVTPPSSTAQHTSSSTAPPSSSTTPSSSAVPTATPTTTPVSSSSSVVVSQSSSSSSVPVASSSTSIPVSTISSSSEAPSATSTGSGVPITDDNSKSSSLSSGAIAGIVIGVIIGVLLLVCLTFFFCFHTGRISKPQRLEDHSEEHSVQQENLGEDETHHNEDDTEEVEMQTV